MPDTPMQAALAAIWTKNLPQVRERLLLLQRAAEELSTSRTIDAELRTEATSIAHKLAGSLGMFGLHSATDAARSIEQTLGHDGLPQPERLQQHVDQLQSLLQPYLKEL